mmetsp:Transcript_26390/g.32943  ORF Transcript_26390/g.32943 Transcript_26390/m.32943 type:complete len:105 (-) Transcript_26390:1571-1885(-)
MGISSLRFKHFNVLSEGYILASFFCFGDFRGVCTAATAATTLPGSYRPFTVCVLVRLPLVVRESRQALLADRVESLVLDGLSRSEVAQNELVLILSFTFTLQLD